MTVAVRLSTPAQHARFLGRRLFLVDQTGRYPNDQTLLSGSAYWVAPARWFDPAWAYFYGKDGGQPAPGVYTAEGKQLTLDATPDDADPDTGWPTLLRGYFNGAAYPVPLEPEQVNGEQVYVRCTANHECTYLALHRAQGELVAIRDDYLDVLTGAGDPSSLPTLYGYRYERHQVQLRQQQGGPQKPVGIFFHRLRQTGGYKGEDGRWIPTKWEDDGLQLAAVVMPHLLAGKAVP